MPALVRCHHDVALSSALPEAPCSFTASRTDSYPVHVCRDESAALGHLLTEIGDRRVALISDDLVAGLHARGLAARLRAAGVDVTMTTFPAGEASKSLMTACDVLDWLAGTALARRDIVVAVGGGVVIDTVGWVASAYMRGVPYVNVPTTLLAHVDAALGGKVAVDHASAKNLIGAFYQPKAVISNVGYLSTLNRRQLASGLAEVVKKAVIGSPELLALVEHEAERVLARDLDVLERLVRAASRVKCALLAQDPYEEDLRRPLNFGHTVGHAVETVTGYGPVLHGEAVAFGMAVAVEIAVERGLAEYVLRDRLVQLLSRIGLPVSLTGFTVPVDPGEVVTALGQIRKIRDGQIRYVLPLSVGETAIVNDVTDAEVHAAMLRITAARQPGRQAEPVR
ncbi:putative 3-dehydroquinate synthase [Actinoplanes missouriensis 431]|uniref:3-dehydroquinate synthase n=1 Tax=Actinoplanes missouriensis (strain ATCC 14538 / DSM 43046 / CBS 188.64 / JCM 3121 / NBRC 102363 / NCIMB 12654 / NRRL B-3342 / UNCC 431) TaxID=512565 RepID=I0H5Z8_ACTM4|nr:putative 3-dehydroquinate synthase [Actinoplanes missouriensis 431]